MKLTSAKARMWAGYNRRRAKDRAADAAKCWRILDAVAKPAAERTVARTYRLPPRTLAQIHAMVTSGASVSDTGAIRDCVDARAEALGIRVG